MRLLTILAMKQTKRVLFAASFAAGVALASLPAHAVLTHYWAFEEADDLSGNPEVKDTAGVPPVKDGNFAGAMTDFGSRSADTPGPMSTRSLDFGSANTINYVDVYSPAPTGYIVMGNAADWTLSLWYKGTDAGGDVQEHVLIGSAAGHANLELRTGGYVVYTHYNGGYQDNVISDDSVTDGVWHNITLVHHADQNADLYVDAVAQVTGVSSTTTAGFPYQIGSFMTATATSFASGKLDDVRIYDNALTLEDVQLLVPEPASVGLLCIGAALVLGRRRGA
jgi:hypothetical protein